MGYVFTSKDGTDEKGIRAEVRVEVGDALVTAIDEKTAVAQISLKVEKLDKPVKAWLRMDSPAFEEAKKAFENKSLIPYRIEQYRKAGEDRETPIDDLRADMQTAGKATTRVFALLNGVEGGEGVTNPKEDDTFNPTYKARYKATDEDAHPTPKNTNTGGGVSIDSETLVRQVAELSELAPTADVLAAAIGAAIALGANPADVFKAAGGKDRSEGETRPEAKPHFSTEAPGWKEWNSDGRMNLGATRFAAGAGAESFVRGKLYERGLRELALEEGTGYFTRLILSIADVVQTKAYGEGSRADRGSASHARIRGIIYDTIDKYIPLPYPEEGNATEVIKKWTANVGKTATERFHITVASTDSQRSFNEPLPTLLYANIEEEKTTSVEEKVSAPKPQTAKKVEENKLPEPVVEETTPVVEEPQETLEDLNVFPPVNINELPVDKKLPLALKETLNELVEYIKVTGLAKENYNLVGNLIKYTFGPSTKGLSKNVPEQSLADFVDYYISAGEENFLKVLHTVPLQD